MWFLVKVLIKLPYDQKRGYFTHLGLSSLFCKVSGEDRKKKNDDDSNLHILNTHFVLGSTEAV